MKALFVGSAVFGFGGAFISLLLSKIIAKWSTGAKVITQPSSETESWLLSTVERLAQKVGIKTPEVAIFPERKVPIPLGDLESATPVCNACTAAHIFRPDED